jgi:hypothetical protein
MTRSILFALALLVGSSQLVFGQETEAAKTIEQLVADRKAVAATAAGLQKSWEENEAAFRKTQPWIDHNAKQQKLQQGYLEVDKRLKALDSAIVERMIKEKGK